MDELTIDDKKYVSSKRAAQITGYAKDYIGQLCREGRVSARLVGRSWYVLESAIQDHRFGPEMTHTEPHKQEDKSLTPASTWESPRYEAAPVEAFPAIVRSEEVKEAPIDTREDSSEQQDLHESWRSWFSDAQEPQREVAKEEHVPVSPEIAPREEFEEKQEESAVAVPIHAVYDYGPRPGREVETPRKVEAEYEEKAYVRTEIVRRRTNTGPRTIKAVAFVVALISIITAAIGTGHFDKYVVSISQMRLLAGVQVYNK